ncbi:hypothetical protein [Cohnella sp. WQ 127256]|uniref:hypothetical protein n=1 Tax=Cohnella sp. WQ 127256 TaxID=2938790 RepID=UPI002117DF41|nr:hypothetical protein [Cohnella sp. WQ 127256]
MKFRIMVALTVISLLFATDDVKSKELSTVAVFDVKQEKVVKVMPLTAELKDSVLELLQSSPTVYGGFSMNPSSGLVLHIPFPSPIQVPHKYYSNKINELYLFLEHGAKPTALLFLDNHKQIIVVLDVDLQKFVHQNDLSSIWND